MNEHDPADPPSTDRPVPVKVRRAVADKKIAGVAAGLARHFDVDVTLVRLGFVGLTFLSGSGLVIYLVAWLIMPVDEPAGVGSPGVAESTSAVHPAATPDVEPPSSLDDQE